MLSKSERRKLSRKRKRENKLGSLVRPIVYDIIGNGRFNNKTEGPKEETEGTSQSETGYTRSEGRPSY